MTNIFLPPFVTPSGEEPTAAGGRQDFQSENRVEHRNRRTTFAAARDAVGEEPIAMGGW
jgi:hypothetical protein